MIELKRYSEIEDGEKFVCPDMPLSHAMAFVSYIRIMKKDPYDYLHFTYKDSSGESYSKWWDDDELVICFEKKEN